MTRSAMILCAIAWILSFERSMAEELDWIRVSEDGSRFVRSEIGRAHV